VARLQRPYQCAGTPESPICSGFRRSCTWRATRIAVPSKVEAPVDADVKTADSATMTPTCEPLQMIEGICRRFLDVVKMEWDCQVFAGTRDVRATVLHNIGEHGQRWERCQALVTTKVPPSTITSIILW